jgi:DNA-binding NarL/FixJ family response regulator
MRILVADDHPLFRDALARIVASVDPGGSVVEAADFDGVRAALAAGPSTDLLLLDLRMPGADGVESMKALARAHVGLSIVVVSGSESPVEARQVLEAGALGCLRKSTQPALLAQVIAGLIDGSGLDHPLLTEAARTPPSTGPGEALTPRQFEVLTALCTGASNKVIARQLGLAEGTVKLHVAAILQALRAESRTEAATRARALGWA